jgi:hypothetical protein
MKRKIAFFTAALLLEIHSVSPIRGQVSSETGVSGSHNIPVYPGASLLTERMAGEEQSCCDFVTKDEFEKVISFYENALKTKSLDASSLASKYTDMKPEINMMISLIPPQLKIRFFVLQEVIFQGKKGAELFELTSDPLGVHFTISETQFLTSDTHFAGEWKDSRSGIIRPKSLSYEQFAAALPAITPEGYNKGEITFSKGDDGQLPGVGVSYLKLLKNGQGTLNGDGEGRTNDKNITISVSINDGSGSMDYTLSYVKELGNGAKAIKVKGKYEGQESSEKNSYGCIGSGMIFLVNNRFLVEIKADGICNLSVINRLIDSMNFENLPK